MKRKYKKENIKKYIYICILKYGFLEKNHEWFTTANSEKQIAYT